MTPTMKKICAAVCMLIAWPLLAFGELFAHVAGGLLNTAERLAGRE